MIEAILRPPFIAAAAGVALIGWVLYSMFKPSKLPDLPIIGLREGEWFAMMRAAWRNNISFQYVIKEAYYNYGVKGQAVLMPLLSGNAVILPPSDTQWLAGAPETQVNSHALVREIFQWDYTVMDMDLVHRPIHVSLITTTLTKQVGNLVPDVMDEVEYQVSQEWGMDTSEWKEVPVYGSMHRIISRVSNRVFVGLPACRSPELTKHAQRYSFSVPISSYILRCTNGWIKPFVGALITLPGRWARHQYCKLLKPVVEQRLKEYDARQADPEASKTEPNDFLEWLIKQAKEIGDPSLFKPQMLADRILILNFAAIHTTSIAITGTIIEIVCHNKPEYIDEIRKEIVTVLGEHGGKWDKLSLAKMHKLDSTLRESMRLNSFVVLGLGRKVTAKEGVDAPCGVHLPCGSQVVVPSYTMMHDEKVYEDAEEFKPFRFAEQRADESVGYVERARKSVATTNPNYLGFGHGKNACPGRFFAANELKLLFAYTIMNYDFKMETERPADTFFGILRVVPMRKKIWVRRKEKT